jgi:hypothetical protein
MHLEGEPMSERDERLTFVILWLFAELNYIYADIGMIFSIFVHPDQLMRLRQGLGSGGMSDAFFLGGAVLMEIGFATMLLSWVARHGVARWANILAGILFTVVILVINFARGIPPLNYYSFCGVIEIATTAYITWRAWKWRPAGAVVAAT